MKRFRKNPYLVMFSLYWRFLTDKKKAILFMVMQFCSRIIQLLAPYLFGQVLNTIQTGWPDMRYYLWRYIWALGVIPFIEWLLHGPARVWEEQLSFQTANHYQLYLYQCATTLPLERHTDNHSGETIDKINKAKNALANFSGNIYTSFGTFISFFWALIALMWIRPMIWIFLIILWIIVLVLITWFDKKIVMWIKEENILSHKVWSLLFDYLSNIKTLITLRFLEPTQTNLKKGMDDMYIPFNKHNKRNERKWFTTSSLLQVSLLLVIVAYMYHAWATTGVIVVWTITMIYQYTERVSNTFYNVARQYSQMVRNVANTQSADTIITAFETLKQNSNLTTLGNRTKIAVKNLSFSYKWEDNKIILSDVSLSMKRWEKIAFVGESGSGKSTFLSLLRGLYDPQKVLLEIDKKKYNNLSVLSNDTSLIPQEPEIFEETIAFNISMWLDLPQDTLEKYAKIARFHDIAIWLPHSYTTNIKEKWVNLSGWQKQRLALARGLLVAEDSSIVLLDESTSSVDSINEKKIYTSIFEEFKEKTIIAAIHKIHLLSMFDMIYVFDGGKIIESGRFDDLIAQWWVLAKMREEYQTSHKKRK